MGDQPGAAGVRLGDLRVDQRTLRQYIVAFMRQRRYFVGTWFRADRHADVLQPRVLMVVIPFRLGFGNARQRLLRDC